MVDQNDIHQLIIHRALSEEEPGNFKDGKKIAAVFEPGGLGGGAIEAGAASGAKAAARFAQLAVEHKGDLLAARNALDEEQRNFEENEKQPDRTTSCFDSIYCGSAGAPVASYFVTGTTISATPIFFDPDGVATKLFLDITRVFKYAAQEILGRGKDPTAKPMMDIEKMLDILKGQGEDPSKKLDIAQVFKAAETTPIRFAVMDLETMQRKLIDPCKTGNEGEFFTGIKHTCHIPGVAGEVDRYCDGMTSPIDLVDKNVDHVLVFSALPKGASYRKTGLNKLMGDIVIRLAHLGFPNKETAKKYIRATTQDREKEVKIIEEARQQTDRYVFLGLPEGSPLVPSSCINRDVLRKAVCASYLDTMKTFLEPTIRELEMRGFQVTNKDVTFNIPERWQDRDAAPAPDLPTHKKISTGIKKGVEA